MLLQRTVDPSIEPVTLEEAKLHLRVDGTEEDSLISILIQLGREYVETYTGRPLITQSWKMILDGFYSPMQLYKLPIQEVVSVTYADTAGDVQTLSTDIYKTVFTDYDSYIEVKDGQSFPETLSESAVVEINTTAGYGLTADTVPAGLKNAILLLVGSYYQNRETIYFASIGTVADLPRSIAIDTLLNNYKLPRV